MLEKGKFKLITFLSAKGGVGKSSLIINLAYIFKKKRLESLILDTNFIFPNIDIFLGESKNIKELKEFLEKDKSILEFIRVSKTGIRYISLPMLDISDKQRTGINKKILKSIKGNIFNLDFIFVDTPSGVDEENIYIATHSDRVIVITSSELASLSNTYILLKHLSKKTAVLPEILINKVSNKEEAIDVYEDLKQTVKSILKMEIKFLGYVNEDKALNKAVKEGNIPLKSFYSPYMNSLKSIFERLVNNRGGM
ncbi:MAG: hypothetical protein DSY59_04085 [Persephonella sp.]|nr:MAG: hypothetical protein DSY60_05650 [Persephonella sp.]RUM59665.1 MAG: hypothetical protein DSY59_04085 [Persephonella sp.]